MGSAILAGARYDCWVCANGLVLSQLQVLGPRSRTCAHNYSTGPTPSSTPARVGRMLQGPELEDAEPWERGPDAKLI